MWAPAWNHCTVLGGPWSEQFIHPQNKMPVNVIMRQGMQVSCHIDYIFLYRFSLGTEKTTVLCFCSGPTLFPKKLPHSTTSIPFHLSSSECHQQSIFCTDNFLSSIQLLFRWFPLICVGSSQVMGSPWLLSGWPTKTWGVLIFPNFQADKTLAGQQRKDHWLFLCCFETAI